MKACLSQLWTALQLFHGGRDCNQIWEVQFQRAGAADGESNTVESEKEGEHR